MQLFIDRWVKATDILLWSACFQMERTILVWSNPNILDQLWRWSTLTGLVISVGRTEMSLSIWQNCFPSPALLYPAYKNNNQTCGGLGRVCATGMYRSIAKFPKCWMESAHGIRIQREKFESNRSLCPVHADLYLFQTWDEIFFLRFGLLSARI